MRGSPTERYSYHDPGTWDREFKNTSSIQYRPNMTTFTECRDSPARHEILAILDEILPDPRDETADYEVFISVSARKKA